MKLIQTEEEKFLRSKYRSMESRVRNNSYYSTVENEYENERDFIEYWIGKVDYKANPELDRIDRNYGYSKLNNQWLSKAEHKVKSSKERANGHATLFGQYGPKAIFSSDKRCPQKPTPIANGLPTLPPLAASFTKTLAASSILYRQHLSYRDRGIPMQ